tara:strand:- start:76 stop:315 length:240 start_codon:yes stop_codon:yes gene_type:complete
MENGTRLFIGNFILSVSKFNNSEVALLSKHTGEFVKLNRSKTNKILRKVKRIFKIPTYNEIFCFHCVDHDKLINILKGK